MMNTKSMYTKRDPYIDIARGLAVVLMIFGHCLQYGSGEAYLTNAEFYSNRVFEFIYSFHMPLFMVVSGLLFEATIRKYSFLENIASRFTKILLPIICWVFLEYVIKTLCGKVEFVTLAAWVNTLIRTCLTSLWFLWAVFYSSLIVLIINKCFRDSVFAYIAVLIMMLILPDIYNFHLYKYMYVYFVGAYLYKKNKSNSEITLKYIPIVSALIYTVMMGGWNVDKYIYRTRICIIGREVSWFRQLGIDIYRWVVGALACIVVMDLLKAISDRYSEKTILKVIGNVGKNSLGIYLISGMLFDLLIPGLTRGFEHNILINLVETILVLAISVVITWTIKKSPILNRVLLGSR